MLRWVSRRSRASREGHWKSGVLRGFWRGGAGEALSHCLPRALSAANHVEADLGFLVPG